ncbi:MAG: aspartate/glutamate racemase family protein [Thermomicrobiales bacterium]|nr:aspartate/glutamate racemase family protein [Thermomicrobiales bacterium]
MYKVVEGRATYGHSIGIIMQHDGLIRMPGDVGNLTTYTFPVTYRVVKDFPMTAMMTDELLDYADVWIDAARDLVEMGCAAVTAGCGFAALLQPRIAAAVDVPVFMSALIQVPLVSAMLAPGRKVGIITANGPRLTEDHFFAAGWSSKQVPVKVIGIEEDYHGDFSRKNLLLLGEEPGIKERMEGSMVRLAQKLLDSDPAVGAIVLECTNMPPMAAAVQQAVGLPVFDIVTLINMVHESVTRRPYNGHF